VAKLISRGCKRAIYFITALGIPYFIIRLILNPELIDILSTISLIISLLTVPIPDREAPGIKSPGRRWIALQLLNIMASFVMMVWVWFPHYWRVPIANQLPSTWAPDTEMLVILPWCKLLFLCLKECTDAV
jgi:hypothetical protein